MYLTTKTHRTIDITQSATQSPRNQATCRREGDRSIRYGPGTRETARASSSASNFSITLDSTVAGALPLEGSRAVEERFFDASSSCGAGRGKIVRIARI